MFPSSEKVKILQELVEGLDVAALACTPDGEIVYSNEYFRALIEGEERKDGESLSLHKYLSSHSWKKIADFLSRSSPGCWEYEDISFLGSNSTIPLKVKLLKGEEYWYLWSVSTEGKVMELQEQLLGEIKKAQKLHRMLLPRKLPSSSRARFAAHYYPAQHLGGDFYDAFNVDSGVLNLFFDQIVFYLTDVSGHGLDSSLLTVFIRDVINGYFNNRHQAGELISPARVLEHLLKEFQEEDFPPDYFSCVFFGVLDLNLQELTYSSAGFHIPSLVASSEGVTELECGGLPLSSVLPRELVDLQEHQYRIEKGGTFLFCTDGLMDQESGELSYRERLQEVFYQYYHLPPALVINIIVEDFFEFLEKPFTDDDVTFLVVQVEPDEMEDWSLEIGSSLSALTEIEKQLKEILQRYFDEPRPLMLGFHEVAVNSVEHGSQFSPEKTIKVSVSAAKHYVEITLEDESTGFQWRPHLEQEVACSEPQEKGKELGVAQKCYDYIYYSNRGQQVSLVKLR